VLNGTQVERRLELTGNEGAISPEDRQRIVASATDYIESWIAGDADRMAGCMHPELIKRSVEPDPQTGGTIVRAEVEPLDVDDTLGAGDAFAGGFLFSLARGADLGVALRAGCDTATAALRRSTG